MYNQFYYLAVRELRHFTLKDELYPLKISIT